MSYIAMTRPPPRIPRIVAKTDNSGTTREEAIRRGTTKKYIGLRPKVVNAFNSSLTFWVPSWAAKAEPLRPAKRIAVIRGPNSLVIAIPIPLTTKITAPKIWATKAVSKAIMTPIKKPIRQIMPTALLPASSETERISPKRIWDGCSNTSVRAQHAEPKKMMLCLVEEAAS